MCRLVFLPPNFFSCMIFLLKDILRIGFWKNKDNSNGNIVDAKRNDDVDIDKFKYFLCASSVYACHSIIIDGRFVSTLINFTSMNECFIDFIK